MHTKLPIKMALGMAITVHLYVGKTSPKFEVSLVKNFTGAAKGVITALRW